MMAWYGSGSGEVRPDELAMLNLSNGSPALVGRSFAGHCNGKIARPPNTSRSSAPQTHSGGL